MAFEFLVVFDEDAAQRHTVSCFQLVHVVTIAGAHVRQSVGELFIGHGDIPLESEFHIVDRAFGQRHRQTCPFGD
ncbi:hypothetical protein D3C87_1711410 [compost metagenome]